MRRVEWGFRVILPENTTLTKLEIRNKKSTTPKPPHSYDARVQAIFEEITGEHVSWSLLSKLEASQRLDLSFAVAAHLSRCTEEFPRAEAISAQIHIAQSMSRVDGLVEPDIHLTPPELAREIAEYAIREMVDTDLPVHFGDPAVGTGAFYSALLQVLPRERVASAIGVDISLQQIAAAKWRWEARGMEFVHQDYLHMEKLPLRNLILANPPYLRHQGMHAEYKRELRDRASVVSGMRVSARSGLYVYFMLLSHSWMHPDATAAWLIPSEFMQTNYGSALRNYLTHHVQLLRVHRFSHDYPQFENAMVLPSVVVFRNRPAQKGDTVHLSAGGTLSCPSMSRHTTVDELRRVKRWLIPAVEAEAKQFSPYRIRDLFTVRRGIATGANDFFIIERTKAARLGIPEEALRPVLPKARALKADIIEGDEDGYPKTRPQLCLLDCGLPEEEIRDQYPGLIAYLDTASDKGIRNRTLVSKRKPWYRQEQRNPPRFLCTYMGRGSDTSPPIRFLWNRSRAIATNTYLMLYPHPRVEALLADEEICKQMFEILQETARTAMTVGLRVHADGLHKIEPGDLLDVPLASTPEWLASVIDSDLLDDPME